MAPIVSVSKEKPLLKIVRKVVGILLATEAALLAQYAMFGLIFTPLMGGLAFLGGAGNTTHEQVRLTWMMIALMTIAPVILTLFTAIAAMSVLQRKRPVLIAIVGLVLITVQVGFQQLVKLPFFNMTTLLLMLVPVASILISFSIKRPSPSSVS